MAVRLAAAIAAGIAFLAMQPAIGQTPKRGGLLQHYTTTEPPNLDCHQSVSILLLALVRPIYSNLVRFDQNNYPAITGDIAQSWTVSPDGLTYTFKLAPNVKFHDGSPLTSADVKATFDRIRNPPQGVPSMRKIDFGDVTSVEAPDAVTVVFKLSQPGAATMDLIASPFNCIYSARRLQENPVYPATEAFGSGPFQYVQWTKGSFFEGKRFDGYFRAGLPYLDGYRTLIMAETAGVNAFAGGQVDASIRALTPQEIDRLRAQLGDKIATPERLLSLVGVWTPNLKRKPYDDVRVRRALSLAVDRRAGAEAMRKISTNEALGGFMRPGYDMALSDADLVKLPGFSPDIEASRAEARRLLAEAGQSNLKPNLIYRNDGTNVIRAVFVNDQWQKIGVQAVMEPLEAAPLQTRARNGEFDVYLESNSSTSDDPTMMLSKWVPGTAQNFGGISDPKLTELFEKQKVTLDRNVRKQYVNEFDRLMIDQTYTILAFWSRNTPVLRTYVKGWQVTSNFNLGYELTEVWLDK